jgi:hypothetical protein
VLVKAANVRLSPDRLLMLTPWLRLLVSENETNNDTAVLVGVEVWTVSKNISYSISFVYVTLRY